ncbi:uncharacterized protein smim28 [Sphaeramia orbicularis]|uniref:uncharacterized protein smim28 n=1 Tax=Sphaeramia orbicularis TaxID=375764 RepID=UPI00117FFA4B|nr:uncharacterized protein LOC115417577 [Sphaeramia orbicularis]
MIPQAVRFNICLESTQRDARLWGQRMGFVPVGLLAQSRDSSCNYSSRGELTGQKYEGVRVCRGAQEDHGFNHQACEQLLNQRPLLQSPPLFHVNSSHFILTPITPSSPHQHQPPSSCSVYFSHHLMLQQITIYCLSFRPLRFFCPSTLSIMRVLLDSSWMRFGPAGRESYDWVTGSPSTQETQVGPTEMRDLFNKGDLVKTAAIKDKKWNELDLDDDRKSELVVYMVFIILSILILALLVGLAVRRWSRTKLSLANIIALDFQDAESSAEILSSLTRNVERHTSTSSDGSDGVFVMVYLPPPYEETLTKITRAASLSSSKDVESMKIEDLEAKLCPELKSSGQYV